VSELRRARPEELTEVGELTVRAYAADGFITPDHPYADSLRDAESRDREAEIWVAVDDSIDGSETGTLLGSVTYCPVGSSYRELARPDEGEFRMLAVDPQARGRGIGRELATLCLTRSRELGFEGVMICSLPEMTNAHALYRSLGFVRTEDRDWEPAPGVVLWAFTLRFT
jgi:ribosomal protein S18 acetylase RimI-like enzyme